MRPCYAENTSQKSKGGGVSVMLSFLFLEKPRAQMRASLHWLSLEGVCGIGWEVYYRCEIMQYISRVNVYSFSKFNPPTFKCCSWKWTCWLGLCAWNTAFITMWIRGWAVETVERYPGPVLPFGQHSWLQFIKSESEVSVKISDLSLVQVSFRGVLAFCMVWGMLDFCQGPGRGQKAHSAGMWKRSYEGTHFQRCKLAKRTKRFWSI